jgi:hypothetical protein
LYPARESDSDDVVNREQVLRVLEGRRRLLLLAGHIHTSQHDYLGPEEGWRGTSPLHQHTLTTACGSWWRGRRDERGIPFSPLPDGAENGYHVYSFDRTHYSSRFKAPFRPASYQLRVYVDAEYNNDTRAGLAFSQLGQQGARLRVEQLPSTVLVANVFSAGERARVTMRVDAGSAVPMERVERIDPWYRELYERQAIVGPNEIRMSRPVVSTHIWQARLPAELDPGLHVATVRVEDQYGQAFATSRVLEVYEVP